MIAAESTPRFRTRLPNDIRIQKALKLITHAFSARTRETLLSAIRPPTLSHLLEVAEQLAQHGYSHDVITAGLLHDLPRESGGWQLARIYREFGAEVGELIGELNTEAHGLHSAENLRNGYMRLLSASAEALAVACADKISELRNALDHLKLGSPVCLFVAGGFESLCSALWEYDGLFAKAVAPSLHALFHSVLGEFEAAGRSFRVLYAAA